MTVMRLQKFLSQAGICSRRQAEAHMAAGWVTVNGRVVDRPGVSVDPKVDTIAFKGRIIRDAATEIYIALFKPCGYVSTLKQKNARTVKSLVNIPQRVNPVGRLDKDSRGLLLMTNNGWLHQRLTHPSFDHEKEYAVRVDGAISDDALALLAAGMPLDGRLTRTATVRRLAADQFGITLKEGRNRQIRRMAERVGHRVTDLKRVRIANIRLKGLAEGAWRYLEPRELAGLLRLAGQARPFNDHSTDIICEVR